MSESTAQAGMFLYACCDVTVAPVRREPSHKAEQTNQLLFGERVEVLQHNEQTAWALIRCAWDGYEGWCKMGQLRLIETKEFRKKAILISSSHNGVLRMEEGALSLPLGSELTGIKKSVLQTGHTNGRFKGKRLDLRYVRDSSSRLLTIARSFVHAPYQWGGRSMAGIDCSGLVQIAFKCCGIKVLRDAAQQASMGEEVHFLAETLPGDLAFFDNDDGRIVHVGILIDRQHIIHATDTSGRIVEDRIDNAGIISISLRRRTHKLRMIRRIAL